MVPYHQQHAFALSNSESSSPPLWIHLPLFRYSLAPSPRLLWTSVILCSSSTSFSNVSFHERSSYQCVRLRERVQGPRLSVKSAGAMSDRQGIVGELDPRSGWPLLVLWATLYRILMKIDCFDKDNGAGNNNVGVQVRRRRCVDTDRYRVQT